MPDAVLPSERARALVSAELRGDITFAAHEDSYVLSRRAQLLELDHHPVTKVTLVKVAGQSYAASSHRVTPFGIERRGLWWPENTLIEVNYQTGWAAGEEPAEIRQALELIDEWLATDPAQGLASVEMGNVKVSRGLTLYGIVPDVLVKKLVDTYRRP